MKNAYRPSVAGVIIDSDFNFLMVELNEARVGEYDFVKGGVEAGETKLNALAREIGEELGDSFLFEVVEQSHWYLVYDWPEKLQKEKGFLGQARTSYWVFYKGGKINLNQKELRSYKWVPENELQQVMLDSGFPKALVESFFLEWGRIKNKNIFV